MVLQMDLQGDWRGLTRLAPIGDRSYSLYLIHYPVITLVFRVLVQILGHSPLALSAIVLVVAGALCLSTECLYRGVERPSHQWARAFRFSPSRAVVPVSGTGR
jgi:peptidoglycan/LPS O-acetylase OafA/YrhL